MTMTGINGKINISKNIIIFDESIKIDQIQSKINNNSFLISSDYKSYEILKKNNISQVNFDDYLSSQDLKLIQKTAYELSDWFKDKKINQIITVKIISTDNKGLIVRPEGCEMDFQIKKSAIAINAADARPSRWTGGEKLDCAISELDFNKRKVTLSIKLLEEIEKKEALDKYGAEGSGKNLPFSSLSEDLKKKDKKKD